MFPSPKNNREGGKFLHFFDSQHYSKLPFLQYPHHQCQQQNTELVSIFHLDGTWKKHLVLREIFSASFLLK